MQVTRLSMRRLGTGAPMFDHRQFSAANARQIRPPRFPLLPLHFDPALKRTVEAPAVAWAFISQVSHNDGDAREVLGIGSTDGSRQIVLNARLEKATRGDALVHIAPDRGFQLVRQGEAAK